MGWKVGEVSFLFLALALRGAGTGCLLTMLGRGGGGRRERVQEGKPYAVRQSQRAGGREQTRARAETGGNGARRSFLSSTEPAWKEEPREREDGKPDDSFNKRASDRDRRDSEEGGQTKHQTSNLQRERQLGFNRR